MLQARGTQELVSNVFNVAKRTIERLWRRFNTSGSVSHAPGSIRRPVKTGILDTRIGKTASKLQTDCYNVTT